MPPPHGDKFSFRGVDGAAGIDPGNGAVRRGPRVADASGYILIAIPSQNRADAIRQLALDLSSNVVVLRDGAEVIRHIDSQGAPSLLTAHLGVCQFSHAKTCS